MAASDIVAIANGLGIFRAQHEGRRHIINVDGMQESLATVNDAKQPLFNGREETEQVQIARPINETWTDDAYRQSLLSVGCQRERSLSNFVAS